MYLGLYSPVSNAFISSSIPAALPCAFPRLLNRPSSSAYSFLSSAGLDLNSLSSVSISCSPSFFRGCSGALGALTCLLVMNYYSCFCNSTCFSLSTLKSSSRIVWILYTSLPASLPLGLLRMSDLWKWVTISVRSKVARPMTRSLTPPKIVSYTYIVREGEKIRCS